MMALAIVLAAGVSNAQTLPLSVPSGRAHAMANGTCECSKPSSTPRIGVFLDGNIKGTDKKSDETKSTNGSLALAIGTERWDASFSLNVASQRDTIKSAYGESLLAPGGGGFSAGTVDLRRRLTGRTPNLFLRGYLSASSLLWQLPDTGLTARKIATGVNAVGAGLGFSWQALDGVILQSAGDNTQPAAAAGARVAERDSSGQEPGTSEKATRAPKEVPVSARLDFAATRRAIHGDLMSSEFDSRRIAALGTSKSVYYGFEIGAQLQYSDIRGSIVYYSFPRAQNVKGLTRGQVVAAFAIAAPFFEGQLSK